MKNDEIKLIREELTRRKDKAEQAADIYVLFDAIFDFVDMIENTPVLKGVIDAEEKHWEKWYDYIYENKWEKQECNNLIEEHLRGNICQSDNYPYIYHVYKYVEECRSAEAGKHKYEWVARLYIDIQPEDGRLPFKLGVRDRMRKMVRDYKRFKAGSRYEEERRKDIFECRKMRFNDSVSFVYDRMTNALDKHLSENKLAGLGEEEAEIVPDRSLSFDKENGILHFQGCEIGMRGREDINNACMVLEHIFNNADGLGAISSYREICEETFRDVYEKDNRSWRRIYRACSDIQRKVQNATGIKDFLVYSSGITGQVRINGKYLE